MTAMVVRNSNRSTLPANQVGQSPSEGKAMVAEPDWDEDGLRSMMIIIPHGDDDDDDDYSDYDDDDF